MRGTTVASKGVPRDPSAATIDSTADDVVSRQSHGPFDSHSQQFRVSGFARNSIDSAAVPTWKPPSEISIPSFRGAGGHSAPASATSTQISFNNGLLLPSQYAGIPVKGLDLKAFNRPISEYHKQRFDDLKRLYSGALLDTARQGLSLEGRRERLFNCDPADLSMKCKFIGSNEWTAELYIVVQCSEVVSRMVKAFFAQEHVAKDLGTDFRLHIIEEPLRRLIGINSVRAFGDMGPRNTLCGLNIRLSLSGRSRMATLGGLVMVVTTTRTALFGIIAGHAVSDIRGQTEDEISPLDKTGFGEGMPADPGSRTPTAAGDQDVLRIALPDDSKVDLGVISHDSFVSSAADANYDWALVELKPEHWLPNLLDFSWKPGVAGDIGHRGRPYEGSIQLSCFCDQSRFSPQPAVVITSRGTQRGTLTQNKSSIAISPGKCVVETLEFTPDSESALQLGDSGSWVVSPRSGEVYGHVVSTDAFGEAFVMPIQQTLDNIRLHLQAIDVVLPTSEDIDLLKRSTRNVVTALAPPIAFDATSHSPVPNTAQASGHENARQDELQPQTVHDRQQDVTTASPPGSSAVRTDWNAWKRSYEAHLSRMAKLEGIEAAHRY